jgi:hypothetical protein
MRLLPIVILIAASILLTGCTGNAVYLKNTKSFAATDPKTIQLYSSTTPPTKFEVIGYVSTYTSDASQAGDMLKNDLRAQAAKYGANAIIAFKFNIADTGGGGAQGVAVRYLP